MKLVLLAWMVGLCVGLPHQDFDAAEIMLDSLSETELDRILADKLGDLEVGIMASYAEHLRDHENTLQQLHHRRRRRNLPDRPTIPADFWHGYVFGTLPTRERTVVDSVSVGTVHNIRNIVDVYPINLASTKAIYKDGLGHGYIYKDGKMNLLMIRNRWTRSTSGCPCSPNSSDMSCACCSEGGRLCSEGALSGRTCVGSDGDLGLQCTETVPRHLELDAVVAFEYNVAQGSYPANHREVLITAKNKTVSFYKLDEEGVQELPPLTGHSDINIGEAITHLGMGELYKEECGSLVKKRYLFLFGETYESKMYFEVMVNTTTDVLQIGLAKVWEESGSEMQVWQNGAQVMMGVLNGTNLHILELLPDCQGTEKLVFLHNVPLPSGVKHWRSFSSGFDKFLIAVTPTVARIYIQREWMYEPLQDLIPNGISGFEDIVPLPIPSCKDDVILLTGSGTTLIIYTWNNTASKFVMANQTTISEDIVGWDRSYGTLGAPSTSVPTVILQAATSVVALEVTSSLHDILDDKVQESKALQDKKIAIENEYARQTTIMTTMQDRLNNAVDPTTTTTLTGDYTIQGIDVERSLKTSGLTAVNMIFPSTDFATGVSYEGYKNHIQNLSNSDSWLSSLDVTLTQISTRLQDAVPVTGNHKKITGVKHVVAGIDISNLASDVSIDKVIDANGQEFPLTEYLTGLISYNDARKITGKKTYMTRLGVTNLETPSLDDIPVSDIATITGQYSLVGTTSFSTFDVDNVILPNGGTVGGIDLSNAVLLNGQARLGHVVFTNVSVTQDLEVGDNEVDGVVINNLYKNALTKAGGKLKGPITFTNDVIAKSLTADLLSGVNSSTFLSTTVFKDEDAQLTGKLTVPTLVTKSLQVGGLVNGKNFPSDFPLKTAATLDLGTKSFNHLICESVQVSNVCTVDGVLFSNLVTLHGAQVITGKIILAEPVTILGNLNVTSSLVKGIDFNQLNSKLIMVLNPQHQFDVIFKGHISLPTIAYNGNLRGLNLNDLATDIIYTSDATATISGTKSFSAKLKTDNAAFDSTFNGRSFDEFVTVNDAKPIAGVKTFKKPVTFASNVNVTGLVDNVNLKTLFDSALYLDKAGQVVTGRKTFTNGVSAGRLQVQGKVSDVDFNMVLTKNGDQVFTAPQQLAAASFGALDTNQIDMSDGFEVNGIDISELDSIRMSRKNPTAHSGTLTVNGLVSVLGSLDVESINGYNVAQLKNNIVTDDVDSVISSDVHFASLTVKGPVTTANKGGANGLNISRIAENAVYLNGNNVMTGFVTWGDLTLQGDVAVGGLVNGKDLQAVHNDAVYKDDNLVQLTGRKTFNKLSVKGNIDTATTNGIDLGTRLLTLDTDQDITAAYTFTVVKAESNLTLGGTFDLVNVEALDSTALKQTSDEANNIVFGEVLAGSLEVKKNLNNIDINARLSDAVRLQDNNVHITGRKTFLKNTTFKNLQVLTVNGEDFVYYLTHAVRKTQPITLASNIKVNGLVTAPSVASTSLNIEGTVDNVDYKTLLTTAVLLDDSKSHGIKLMFQNDVSVKGALNTTTFNGADFATDYLTTNTVQNLAPNVEFGDISTVNVEVDGFVNSKKLPDEVANTLNVNGGQTVTGLKTITGDVKVVNNVEVTGNTNNIKMATEAVYLSGASTINVPLNFSNGLTTKSLTSTTNVISGVDMSDLFNNAWYYNEKATISSNIIFGAPVVMKDRITVAGTIDGFDIAQVYANAQQALTQYSTYNEGIKSEYAMKCPLIQEAYKDTEKAIFEADYFRLLRDISFPNKQHASTTFRVMNTTFIIMSWEGECSSTLYRFDESSGQFVLAQTLSVSGYGRDWLAVEHGDEVYLVMAASSGGNSCSKQNSVVWKMSLGTLSVYQDLHPGNSIKTGNGILYVNSPSNTYAYSFDTTTKLFVLNSNLTTEMEKVFLSSSGHLVTISKTSQERIIKVNGQEVHKVNENLVDDSEVIEERGHVFLLAAVTRTALSGVKHYLELYSIDTNAMTLNWLDSKLLHEASTITSFFTGNTVSGKTLAVVMQENYCPTVYSITGSKLSFFSDLPTPRMSWARYIGVPMNNFPEVTEHYLLIGRGTTAKLLHLEMTGMTHEAENHDCRVEDFKYPELIPRVN